MSDTFQLERERAYARQRLGVVFEAPERAFSIHYGLQQRLRRDRTDVSPPVAAIAVRNLGTGQEQVFSIKAEAEATGIDLAAAPTPLQMLTLEYNLLFHFNDFLSRHHDRWFIHWYMRDARFGFQALENRFRTVLAEISNGLYGARNVASAVPFGFGASTMPFPVQVPEANRVDLALTLRQLYGIDRIGLRHLAESNALHHGRLIEGINEPMAFTVGNHARLAWSSATKAQLVVELAELTWSGKLKLPRASSMTTDEGLNIFINYRREDTQTAANWLHAILSDEFGDDNVFIDTDDIPAGIDYEGYLRSQINGCDVFLAMIGRGWAGARDANGNLRLAGEHDFVRREIRAALGRGIPVIPVLVEGTPMPSEMQLPADLMPLRRRQWVELRSREFRHDVEKLVVKLREGHRAAQRTGVAARPG